MIGRLGNFDIRRMLRIAERIFLSPELKIDDIIKSKFGGEDITADRFRTHRALVKGEYDRFNEGENEYISNLFQTNPQRPGPPLLAYYILWLLRQKLNAARNDKDDNVENSHWSAANLIQLFEGSRRCRGFRHASPQSLIRQTADRSSRPKRETFVSIADKVAIESGIAHLELMLTSPVYVEQMGLVTGLNELFARDEMKKNLQKGYLNDVRDVFVRYILKIDAGRLGIPPNMKFTPRCKWRVHRLKV